MDRKTYKTLLKRNFPAPQPSDWHTLSEAVLGFLVLALLTDAADAGELQADLQPLRGNPAYCEEALGWVTNYDTVRAYRDQVLAQGRELLLGDFYWMRQLAQREELQVRAARGTAACRALHGVESETSPA